MSASTDEVCQRAVREAFNAGVRSVGQPRSERERHRVDIMAYTRELIAAAIAAEVERRLAAAKGGAA